MLIGSAVAIMMSYGFARHASYGRFEYPILIVMATLGMMLMISANDLIALYLGLEMQALALYVTAAINRDSLRASEAGLKYFVLGALSSGMLLYGMSLIYGFTGHTNFAGIAEAMAGERSLGLIFGVVFMLAGIAFKVSAVPFHMWTPDVYEGAPTPVTAFFAAAPKVAAMAMLIRVVHGAFEPAASDWQQIISFLAIASMVLGAFAAIGQTNIKRLMAYSSIGHMGFALVGLASGTENGVSGVVIYMLIYMVMTLGTFACILAMRREDGLVEDINELAGLSRTHPMMALMLTALMFSLAGIPPAGRVLGEVFRLSSCHPGRTLRVGGDRCAGERRRCLSTICASSSSYGSMSRSRVSCRWLRNYASCSASPVFSQSFMLWLRVRFRPSLLPQPVPSSEPWNRQSTGYPAGDIWRWTKRVPLTAMRCSIMPLVIRGFSGSQLTARPRAGAGGAGHGNRRPATFMQACCSSIRRPCRRSEPYHCWQLWR